MIDFLTIDKQGLKVVKYLKFAVTSLVTISIDAPDPIEAILFRMKQMEMTKKDLAEVLGYKSRVSEIFSKKRKLNIQMIRNLHEKMNIPYDSLIAGY